MPVNIIKDEEQGYACLYDSVTMQAMGPIFYLASEEPQDFLDYANARWGSNSSAWSELEFSVSDWRHFEALIIGELSEWGFIGVSKFNYIIEMVWEGVKCECKKADLHNATCAEDVLQVCTFFDEEENEMDYEQFKSSQI